MKAFGYKYLILAMVYAYIFTCRVTIFKVVDVLKIRDK